jgi:hypothetical protein
MLNRSVLVLVGFIAIPLLAFAQAATPAVEPPAPFPTELLAGIVGVIVVVASLLANLVRPDTWWGALVHWIALNGPGIQRSLRGGSSSSVDVRSSIKSVKKF